MLIKHSFIPLARLARGKWPPPCRLAHAVLCRRRPVVVGWPSSFTLLCLKKKIMIPKHTNTLNERNYPLIHSLLFIRNPSPNRSERLALRANKRQAEVDNKYSIQSMQRFFIDFFFFSPEFIINESDIK